MYNLQSLLTFLTTWLSCMHAFINLQWLHGLLGIDEKSYALAKFPTL